MLYILFIITISLVACLTLWKASELVMKSIMTFSRSLRLSSFVVAFLILGVLTSITEFSVGVNAIIQNRPSIFVGNLIGGSFVIMLFIIPLLAIFNNGVKLKDHLSQKKLLFFLALIISPAMVVLDGIVSRYDAALLLLFYGLFFYLFHRESGALDMDTFEKIGRGKALKSLGKVLVGAMLIYISSTILVHNTIYISDLIGIPAFLISLLILGIGTNLPEIIIAINSIYNRTPDIAFGNYIGSAATNTLLFAIFTLVYGPFPINAIGFHITFLIIAIGYILFFMFARTKARISLIEGLILFSVYLIFLLFQTTEIIFSH